MALKHLNWNQVAVLPGNCQRVSNKKHILHSWKTAQMCRQAVLSLQGTSQQPGPTPTWTCARSPAVWRCPGDSTSSCPPPLSPTRMGNSAWEFLLRNRLNHSEYLPWNHPLLLGRHAKEKVTCCTHTLGLISKIGPFPQPIFSTVVYHSDHKSTADGSSDSSSDGSLEMSTKHSAGNKIPQLCEGEVSTGFETMMMMRRFLKGLYQ